MKQTWNVALSSCARQWAVTYSQLMPVAISFQQL